MFPKAKFIFLVRNPLSVFSSILDYNFKGNLKNFLTSKDRQDDIFLAPNKIYSAINQYENNILVNYEDIILNPNKNLELIYKYLEVEIPEKYNSYKIDNQFKTSKAIDTKNLLKYDKPTNEFINSWQEVLNTTQKKKVALEFLKKLNYDIKPYFNYNLDDIIDLLKKHKPKVKTNFNLELGYYLSNEEDLSIKQILKKRIYQQMHKYD